MGLETDHAVDDVGARLLQRARPVDVGLLVEPRLQLDERHHLLAGLCRPFERLHDRAVDRCAVQGLLDGEHVRVRRRGLHERLHRRHERLVRMVHENVAAAEHPEDVLRRVARGHEPRRGHGGPRLALQVGTVERGDDLQSRQIERNAAHIDLVVLEIEFARQQAEHALGHVLPDLETHAARAAPTAEQNRLDLLQQVARLVLLDVEVGVARHTEHVVLAHLHPGEQPVEVRGDDLFDRDEALAVGQRDPARQQRAAP